MDLSQKEALSSSVFSQKFLFLITKDVSLGLGLKSIITQNSYRMPNRTSNLIIFRFINRPWLLSCWPLLILAYIKVSQQGWNWFTIQWGWPDWGLCGRKRIGVCQSYWEQGVQVENQFDWRWMEIGMLLCLLRWVWDDG